MIMLKHYVQIVTGKSILDKVTIKPIDYQALLEKHKVFPIDAWDNFSFCHCEPKDEQAKNEQVDFLKRSLELCGTYKHDGIYAYKKGKMWLYIGKGKPIFNRLKSHYRESFQRIEKKTRGKRWIRFFTANRGALTIYWIPVKGETTRKILELALHEYYKPAFNTFEKQK